MKIIPKVILLFLISLSSLHSQNAGDQFFGNDILHQIIIDSDQFDTKIEFIEQLQTISYDQVNVSIDGVQMDGVGVRKKGGISIFDTLMPPIKFDFGEFVLDQRYDGLKKLNFQNNFFDPHLIRDKLAYTIYRSVGVVGPRAAFAEVYFKEEFMGLYTVVDQIDKTFLKENFATNDGDLYKGAFYNIEIKEGDITNYNNFINNVNADNIGEYVNLRNYLKLLAVDVFIEEWDGYASDRHNFFIYYETKSGLLNFITWDHNFAFGNFSYGSNTIYPLIYPEIISEPSIKNMYLETMCEILNYIATDDYLSEVFVQNEALLASNTNGVPFLSSTDIYEVLIERREWILSEIANEGFACGDISYAYEPDDIVINEFLAKSDSTSGVQEPGGGTPDWIELFNNTDFDIVLNEDIYLSDDKDFPKKWHFPYEVILPANDYVTVWADRDVHQPGLHTNFKIDSDGGEIIMTAEDLTIIQSINYSQQQLNKGFARIPNGTGDFVIQNHTFGFDNDEAVSNINISDFKDASFYPNPTQDYLWTTSKQKIDQLNIRNTLGQLVMRFEDPIFPISLQGLNSGVYIIDGNLGMNSFREQIVIGN